MSILYIVGTPIGNLDDLSARATQVLREVPLVAAEDTRVTRKLLNRIGSKAKTISYREQNARRATPRVIAALREGDVALVSDAGAPTVSDPGAELVARVAQEGHSLRVVPGPSAVTAALALSGIPADRFTFVGFLPRRAGQRSDELRAAAERHDPTVIFESPQRIQATLQSMVQAMPERPIAVCRELTKLHEEVFHGTPAEALAHFSEPRGEFVIVVAGAPPADIETTEDRVRQVVRRLAAEGMSGRELVDEVIHQTGASRRQVYKLVLSRPDA